MTVSIMVSLPFAYFDLYIHMYPFWNKNYLKWKTERRLTGRPVRTVARQRWETSWPCPWVSPPDSCPVFSSPPVERAHWHIAACQPTEIKHYNQEMLNILTNSLFILTFWITVSCLLNMHVDITQLVSRLKSNNTNKKWFNYNQWNWEATAIHINLSPNWYHSSFLLSILTFMLTHDMIALHQEKL